ncbi:hypothetical protein V7S43_013292 [Phytophthora oleae]|uniref:Uncharacterized protein n=1 Tax=Phytophthora oleae TaxID=2107226 RepID=A0ABD3F406_9STRA
MILAADAASGTDIIVVQKGEFVLRGAYIRIGSEIRDLCEERVVVQASNDHTPGLTTLKLGIPLRFFHPAKGLVATVLLPSTELAKRLEISDRQRQIREVLNEIIVDTVEKASIIQSKEETEFPIVNAATTLVTSFEPMATMPITSSNLSVGPMMRYFSSWSGSRVSVFTDHLSDRKLVAYWEGLELEGSSSNKKVSTGDLKWIFRRNAYLSLLLSTAQEQLGTKSDDIQLTFQDFSEIFRLPSSVLPDCDEENEIRLQLPLSYLRRHFQVLAQSSTSFSSGFKAVSAAELVRRVGKDIIDHPPIISDDPTENQTALDQIHSVCQHLEKGLLARQAAPVSWPEVVYFVRYNKRLVTPEIFPSQPPVVLDSKDKEVAEIVAGKHSSRLLILFYDGSVEIWDISSSNASLESKAQVLFSTKTSTSKEKKGPSETKPFVQAWMDANQTNSQALVAAERATKRIRQFKRSRTDGVLVRFCAWDSVMCVNSSILEETGSGSFRFFRLVRNFVSPLCQVTVNKVTKIGHSSKKKENASSRGIVKSFQVTEDGAKIVFLTGSETILWIACAITGEIISHVDLKATQAGNFRALFHISETILPSGEIGTRLYATTSAKSYRHVGMWVIPQRSASMERKRVFSFGKTKMTTVVDLSVCGDLLFVASRDGSIAVWSITTDQSSPIPPLACLRIPYSEELQSLWCQSLRRGRNKPKMSVGDKEIDQWEAEMLQHFDPPPLRFSLYLFEDGEVVRLEISGRFDVRLVALNDSEFAFDTFLAPVSGIQQNPASRVVLQNEQVTRVVLIALQHTRDGIFAQKSVQGFFTDLDIHDILWKCHDEMVKFALSYQENVVIQLKPFYRDGDGELIELTPPQRLKLDGSSSKFQEKIPDVVVGAVLKARDGNQTQFQAWKFAMNWITDDIDNDPVPGQVEHARQSLALQSAYRLEAERILRIRDDCSRQDHVRLRKIRRMSLVRCMQDNLRDIITHCAQPDEATDRFLKTVNVYLLESTFSQQGLHPLEQFVSSLFNQASFGTPNDPVSMTKFLRSVEASSIFAAWATKLIQEMEKCDWKKGINWNSLALIVGHIQVSTIISAELGSLLVDLGLANANCTQHDTESASLPNFVQQLHHFLCSRGPKPLTLEAAMNVLHSPESVVEFVVGCTNFSGFFRAKMADLSTRVVEFIDAGSGQRTPEESYAIQLKMITWQRELHHLAQSQNELFPEISEDDDASVLEPTVEDLQQLQRFLTTPLPCVSPPVSSLTLENRCDTIHSRNRFVMNAMGRLGAEFLPLSVVYVFMEGGEEAESEFQQELTFLGKLKHLRAREFFLPVYLDALNVPILSDAHGSMANGSDTGEIHCIVAESLRGWSSVAECLESMRLSNFSVELKSSS